MGSGIRVLIKHENHNPTNAFAERAAAIHDSWHAGCAIRAVSADTFADGLATRQTYEMTFEPLRETLAGRTVAIVLSGSNIDEPTLRRVLNREV